jgi:PAS domain S-box-containing protein
MASDRHGLTGDPGAGLDAGAGEAVVTTDAAGVITSCNRAAQQLLGCRAEDAVGQSLLTFHDPAEVVERGAARGVAPGWEVIAAQGAEGPGRATWTCVGVGGRRTRVSASITTLRGPGFDAGFAWAARPVAADDRGAGESPRSSEGLLAAFDASPVPTAITRAANGVILFANRACLELLGWQDGGFVGRSMVEVGFWTRPDRREAMLELLARDGFVRDLEEEVHTRGGELLTVLASISPIVLDGEACLVGHVHDITQRRRLEEQLRESEERFRQVTETFQQGFLLRDVDPPVVLYASPAVARIFGVDLHDVYEDPQAIGRLIHPADRERVLARRDAMTTATDFEFRIVRPDGQTRWIRTRAEPVALTGGQISRIAAVSEDVTAERELREALRESEELFRLLAENSTDVIGRLSADQRIEYVSPASRTVYGYEPEAMVGRFGWEFIHPDDLEAMTGDFSARSSGPDTVTNTYRVLRGDGDYVDIEAKVRALHDPDSGELVEFHTVARDVSERRQAEADVRRAKEEAELANTAKSEFLSRMSHELRTPLHAILGFGELLGRGDLPLAQREQLEQITKAGRHLLELINEVLDLSRIEEGELHLSLEPVLVEQVVSEAVAMLAPLAAARAVILEPPRAADLALHVLADRQRLKQVLLNLLSNAVKYNREGGTVRVVTTRDDHEAARIEVTDTGIGIAGEDLALAFAAFERLGAEATEVEGTGLGLALTRRLVEAMGGSIGVDSEVGRGTTFWLDLPVVAAPEVALPASGAAGPTPAVPVRTDARTVLYIEDNPSNIKLVDTILRERSEITLLVAQQGSLGMELAREHAPALVLLDLNLPDVSGLEVLRRLRADPQTAQIPVVMVSADATSGQAARMRRFGADGYLTKPFDIAQFFAVIDGSPEVRAPESAGSPPAEPDGPLDTSMLDRLRVLYPDGRAVSELVEIYLADSPVRLEGLASAAAASDCEAVRSAAHAWRGSCSVTGAHRLVALLNEIETRAREGAIPAAQEIAAVEHAYAAVRDALRAQLP